MSKALAIFREQPLPELAVVSVSELLADQLELKAGRTRKAYNADLRAFTKFVGLEDVDQALRKLVGEKNAAIVNGVVIAYQADMRRRGLARATINRRVSALRAVMKLARGAQMTTVELGLVETLKVDAKTRDVRGPGLEVVRNMIQHCDADAGASGLRDAAILRWLLLLGLRRNELRMLMMRDCKLTGDEPRLLVEQKGAEDKLPVEISPAIAGAVDPWLAERGEGPGALFCSLSRRSRGATLGPTGLNDILLRRAELAGYVGGALPDGRKITPHAIRHTAITEVARERGLLAAQHFARHQNPQTTNAYVDEAAEIRCAAQDFLLERL